MIIDVNRSGKLKKSIAWKVQESSIGPKSVDKAVFIGGPTASGKSHLALDLAKKVRGEIINADSRQIYRQLSIGTSQPHPSDLEEIPHHLYAFLEPQDTFTAADYERKASSLIREVLSRGRLPIVVGGTGFYIKALLRGVWPVDAKNEELRKRLRMIHARRGAFFVHKLLMRFDAKSAANIAPQDTYRMIRALEIFLQSGVRRSELNQNQEERFDALKFMLAPGREELNKNIELRTESMFANGWVEEVRQLIRQFPGFEQMPAAKSLGYSEIIHHLNGKMDLEECKATINLRTRQYAKRQRTWFRNQDQFEFLSSENPLHKMIQSVLQWYRN